MSFPHDRDPLAAPLGLPVPRYLQSLWDLWRAEMNRWAGATLPDALPEVHFEIDQSAEAADARAVRLPVSLPAGELGWTDLASADSDASLPATSLLVTVLGPSALCVRLVDLRGGASRPRSLPPGHYLGSIHLLDRARPVPLARVRVHLR